MHPSIRRLVGLAVVAVLLLSGCDSAVVPSALPSAEEPGASTADSADPGAEPTSPVVGQLLGPWRRSPIVLDDGHIAIFSDACAKKAREDLGEGPAGFPTAVVDAQGMAFAIVILSDDVHAVECLLDIDPAGNAIASSVDWFGGDAVEPVDGTDVSVVSYLHSRDGSRTIAFGRIGPKAVKAKLGFDDASVIQAADTNGWWATWWRGNVAAATFVATDSKDIVIGHAQKPPEATDSGVSVAKWWVDPGKPAPTAKSTEIHALLVEQACASGKSAEGRIEDPIVEIDAAAITVTYRVRGAPGAAQDCQGNPETPVVLELPEPLGDRKLLDGGSEPPRDASVRSP